MSVGQRAEPGKAGGARPASALRQGSAAALRRPPRRVAAAVWAAAAIILFVCYWRLSWTAIVNSDGASNALQAWDMLHGNLLLHGWKLSDVSFYTTELPEYMLAELVVGLNAGVVHVAAAATYTMVVLLAALLAKGRATGRDGLIRALIAAGIMLAPQFGDGVYTLLLSPDHIGTAVPVLVAWLILDRAKPRWYVPVVIGALLALALVADQLVFYTGIAPLMLVCAIRAYQGAVRERQPWSSQWYMLSLAAAALASAAAARLLAAAVRAAGGYMVQPVAVQFADPATVVSHIWLWAQTVLLLFGAAFLDRHAGPVVPALWHLAGVSLAAWAVWMGARRFFRDRDLVTALLVVGLLINLGGFLLSKHLVNILSTREIAPVLPLGAVLAGRLLSARLLSARLLGARLLGARLAVVRLMPLLLVVLLGYVAILGQDAFRPAAPAPEQRLADWLVAHHFHDGLAPYWQASVTTLSSRGRVQVSPACGNARRFTGGRWESQDSWYDPARGYANFIVTGKPAACDRGTAAEATSVFGPPARTYRVAGYTILVWDKNLLTSLG
jgi:hypothetical protein